MNVWNLRAVLNVLLLNSVSAIPPGCEEVWHTRFNGPCFIGEIRLNPPCRFPEIVCDTSTLATVPLDSATASATTVFDSQDIATASATSVLNTGDIATASATTVFDVQDIATASATTVLNVRDTVTPSTTTAFDTQDIATASATNVLNPSPSNADKENKKESGSDIWIWILAIFGLTFYVIIGIIINAVII